MTIKLTREQKDYIWCAYENAKNVDSGVSSQRGEHATLISILIRFGFYAGSIVTAYEICERIFGW